MDIPSSPATRTVDRLFLSLLLAGCLLVLVPPYQRWWLALCGGLLLALVLPRLAQAMVMAGRSAQAASAHGRGVAVVAAAVRMLARGVTPAATEVPTAINESVRATIE